MPPSNLSEREAPQAKPPAGRGFGGSAPNYSKNSSLRAARAGAAALVILEYGNMIRRIIDTESRKFSCMH